MGNEVYYLTSRKKDFAKKMMQEVLQENLEHYLLFPFKGYRTICRTVGQSREHYLHAV